jgi:chromosome segregation ATPase
MLLAPSCKRKAIEQLNQKNQELSNLAQERDSIINMLVASFDDLENTLGIEKQEGDAGQRIKRNIEHLKELLEKNDNRYKSLQRIIANTRNERSLFNSRIDSLNNTISWKDNEIADLNRNIANLKNQVNTQQERINQLASFNANQNTKINEMVNKLNTAHFVVGNSKHLKEKEIIVKKGGFLGLFGRVNKLNPQFNRDDFKTVDIHSETVIPLHGEKVNIVTVHPSDTYTITDSSNVKVLEITDPDKFWTASKYLVVENR